MFDDKSISYLICCLVGYNVLQFYYRSMLHNYRHNEQQCESSYFDSFKLIKINVHE